MEIRRNAVSLSRESDAWEWSSWDRQSRADTSHRSRLATITNLDPHDTHSSPRSAPDLSDWDLMQRVAMGEEQAVEALYVRFGALVYQSSRQVLRSRAETEDAVQEIFVRLWRTADRFDPNRAKLVTWVMLITRRHLIDRLRRQTARPDRASLDDSRSDAGGAVARPERLQDASDEGSEGRERLKRQLARLPELQRTVIERAYMQGFSLREIAGQLDAPIGTVKSALSRGLARLRELEGTTEASG